jgi:hypothetical protein
MHDSVATFYGGYDQAGLVRLPLLRVRWVQVAIGVAVVALLLLVAADVSAYSSATAEVRVSAVTWYADGQLLATTAGFTAHPSQAFVLSETCELFCYNFKGAAVGAPFTLVHVSIVNEPIQYTNLTIQAPSAAYSGTLNITLELG